MSKRTFKITMSERCFRFKPDALDSHAPRGPGVFEFVIFDPQVQPIVLFVAATESIYSSLANHLMGNAKPTADELFKISKDVYFDYVAASDAESPEDFKDIAGALIRHHKPRLNKGPVPSSGRFESVELEEN